MSNIYIQEPPTSGKVLLKTSIGDLDIELWSREAPKACRNFVQLCLEGYYENTIFHRVIKGFIAQGGDPEGTGMGGESVYGEPFKNEIHTRLRFVRRGLVALANTGNEDNGSQFFFTLGPTQELQNKHTIFGKVAGDTIYNMIKFDELDTDSNDRPTFPPKIIKTDVLNNPFPDIAPRVKEKKIDVKVKKSKAKGVKNFKLLSFGSEAEDDENDLAEVVTKRSKSIHDLIDDPKLSSETVEDDLFVNKSGMGASNDEDPRELFKNKIKEAIKTQKSESGGGVSDSKNKKVSIDDLLSERSKYESLKKNVKTKGASREALTLQMLSKFKQKIDNLYNSKDDIKEHEKTITDFNSDNWMVHDFKCDDKQLKLAKDANTKSDNWFEITDPRNEINVRKREDSSKALKKLKK